MITEKRHGLLVGLLIVQVRRDVTGHAVTQPAAAQLPGGHRADLLMASLFFCVF
jgi:hypothetical protein